MKDYIQDIHIRASREEVFNAITNPLTIELWSGYTASIEPVADTEFFIFDGDITGRNVAVDPPVLLEQVWDFGDQVPESVVRMELEEGTRGTTIRLTHRNIPDEAYEDISTGWKQYYLGALKSYMEG